MSPTHLFTTVLPAVPVGTILTYRGQRLRLEALSPGHDWAAFVVVRRDGQPDRRFRGFSGGLTYHVVHATHLEGPPPCA